MALDVSAEMLVRSEDLILLAELDREAVDAAGIWPMKRLKTSKRLPLQEQHRLDAPR